MARTAQGRRLTEAHRLAQARLGARTAVQMTAAWRILDPANLDATAGRWLRVAVPVVQSQNRASSRLAANYLRTFRRLELGPAVEPFTPPRVPVVPAAQVATSLTATGPAAVKKAVARSVPLDEAMILGMTRSDAAALRLALLGGRDTVNRTIREDPRALGYARVTSGDPCAFCAMMASRGPVYLSRESAGDPEMVETWHDTCHCQVEPVFGTDYNWPPGAREFREKWDAAQDEARADGDLRRGTSNDALNAFRRSLGAD